MLVYVYKSPKKQDTYLYLPRKNDFTELPDALLKMFGAPKFLTILATQKHQQIGMVDKQRLMDELTEKGFYLQLPPPVENLLKQHLQDNAKGQIDTNKEDK
ncbi:YcgL domain-containing protein [Aliiglaciecola litoralis]|uniref:YcgL domain-containing protein GCM10009114_26810 n=1 Tax=Aliiglaciecola litoralis TaxID=582857 RepID=A0ABN1LN35_9ALTE